MGRSSLGLGYGMTLTDLAPAPVTPSTTACSGAMIATAMAANPIIQSTASDQGVEVSWAKWAVAAIVPGLISLAVLPWPIYKIFPPELKETPEAPAETVRRLAERGPMGRGEWGHGGHLRVANLVIWMGVGSLWLKVPGAW
ncbi:anion permease [Streptomyces fulvoviolaceus]|nr:anion permease [Streptomyces fulvoviolaceus]MCT9079103.1 anion permease [Streptomyces fulvoviolaceus]